MSMRDGSVHAGGFGSIVNCPFGLVHIKVEQDPPTGPILKRADRTVDFAYLVLAHSASLSAHVGGETDRPTHAMLSRHAMDDRRHGFTVGRPALIVIPKRGANTSVGMERFRDVDAAERSGWQSAMR